MPLFRALATDHSYVSTEFDFEDVGDILSVVERLKCKEADVLADNVYSFSVRVANDGMFTIFQRDHEVGRVRIPAFG
jgi:hypothetical protein